MSKNKHQEVRYKVLDECFSKRYGNYTIDDLLEECNKALADCDYDSVSERTIRDDIKFMRKVYKAPIEPIPWNGKKCIYRYSDPKFSIFKTELHPDEIDKLRVVTQMLGQFKGLPQFEWIDELLAVLEGKFGTGGNNKCIIGLEQNLDYTAIMHLSGLVEAITNKLVLQIKYRKFSGEEHDWTIHPYYLKQYNSRWFLFGLNANEPDTVWNIALDRIVSFETSKEKYIENNLVEDFDEYFDEMIGVTKQKNQKNWKVELKFDKERFPYIVSKPLHGSMKIMDKENCIVELNLFPNKELEALILSFGNQVEVLKPKWMRKEIAKKIFDLSNKYSDVQVDCTKQK
ncbi:MAG: WYL domain-containing protein [Fibrobacter sp.]|nr:WYL domain-containing protein [Fibrobacter sp.]